MTALAAYRDDGPLAAALARALERAGTPGAAAARGEGRFAWAVPPVLRLLEYGALIALSALAGGSLPGCFALLAVLAFHHYDIVYRLRHQRIGPPAWLRAAGGGWEGRLIGAAALAALGLLAEGTVVAAVVLGVLYVTESVRSWVSFLGGGPSAYDDEDAAEE